jgi:hypothetical protein
VPTPILFGQTKGDVVTKFTIVVAVFALGAIVGRTTAPTPVLASAAKIEAISIDELTRKAGPLPVEIADAV